MVSHDPQIKIQNHHPGLQGLLTSFPTQLQVYWPPAVSCHDQPLLLIFLPVLHQVFPGLTLLVQVSAKCSPFRDHLSDQEILYGMAPSQCHPVSLLYFSLYPYHGLALHDLVPFLPDSSIRI